MTALQSTASRPPRGHKPKYGPINIRRAHISLNDEENAIMFADWLEQYEPKDLPEWPVVRAMTLEAVRLTEGPTNYNRNHLVVWSVSRFLVWGHFSRGIPLDFDLQFTDANIQRFVEIENTNEGTARTLRYRLNSVAKAVRSTPPPLRKQEIYGASDPAEPYTRKEITSLLAMLDNQKSRDRSQRLRAAITLGLGVGADGRNISALRGRDVSLHDGLVLVRLTKPDRSVPALHAYADIIMALAIDVGENGLLIGTSKVPVSDSLARFVTKHDPVIPSLRRMRSTFIVTLLQASVPLRVVMDVAGFSTARRLAEYSKYLPTISVEQAQRLVAEAGQ